MTVPESKVTSLIWGTLDHTIITGHENGSITQWDLRVRTIYQFIHIYYLLLLLCLLIFIVHFV